MTVEDSTLIVAVRPDARGGVLARVPVFALVRRFGKFAIVGLSGTCIHLGLLWLLTSRLGVQYLVAGALGFEAGLCSNYVLNNNWTFADRRSGFISARGLARYHVVSLGGFLISLAVLQALTGVFRVPPVLAGLAGIPLVTSWNFALSLFWTWQEVRP